LGSYLLWVTAQLVALRKNVDRLGAQIQKVKTTPERGGLKKPYKGIVKAIVD